QPDSPRRLPLGDAVLDLRAAPRDRLPEPGHRADLRRRAAGHARGRPRGPGADPDGRGRERRNGGAAACAGDRGAEGHRHDRPGPPAGDARLMDALVPLPVVIPLIAAAALAAGGHFLGRRVDDLVGIAAAAASGVISTLLLLRSLDHDLVYWFGGWTPRHGIALGIAFDVEPLSAALAALAAVVATASFVFGWRYYDEVGTLFHVLTLAFLAAMSGFV